MLTITYQDGISTEERQAFYEVSNRFPPSTMQLQKIIKVEADGDELDYIKRNMVNVPYNKNNDRAIWFGVMAKFIVKNW